MRSSSDRAQAASSAPEQRLHIGAGAVQRRAEQHRLDAHEEPSYPDRVPLKNLTSSDAVLQAAAEYDRTGREAFLAKYRFGPSRGYFLQLAGRRYDSKAIVGAAHGYEHPDLGPLKSSDFSGGEATVKAKLEELGFEVVNDGDAQEPALQLVVKWSPRFRPDTVERHIEVTKEEGAVWWGLRTSAAEDWKISEAWLTKLRSQISGGIATYVFISGPTCWRTSLLGVEYAGGVTEQELIPSYYSPEDKHHLWVKLTNFEPTEKEELIRTLDPVRRPGKLIALGNQTNPLLVTLRDRPRSWWVNQGSSFRRAREGGHIWAPDKDKRGASKPHWTAMRYLRQGDHVLHYANTEIRATGRVREEATPSSRPNEVEDQAWGDQGLRAEIDYHDLAPHIRLIDIQRIGDSGRAPAGRSLAMVASSRVTCSLYLTRSYSSSLTGSRSLNSILPRLDNRRLYCPRSPNRSTWKRFEQQALIADSSSRIVRTPVFSLHSRAGSMSF
jgi:hypothetical protein